jgi:hypothetical protein
MEWPDDEAGAGTDEAVAGSGICMPCMSSCAIAGSASIKPSAKE